MKIGITGHPGQLARMTRLVRHCAGVEETAKSPTKLVELVIPRFLWGGQPSKNVDYRGRLRSDYAI